MFSKMSFLLRDANTGTCQIIVTWRRKRRKVEKGDENNERTRLVIGHWCFCNRYIIRGAYMGILVIFSPRWICSASSSDTTMIPQCLCTANEEVCIRPILTWATTTKPFFWKQFSLHFTSSTYISPRHWPVTVKKQKTEAAEKSFPQRWW